MGDDMDISEQGDSSKASDVDMDTPSTDADNASQEQNSKVRSGSSLHIR